MQTFFPNRFSKAMLAYMMMVVLILTIAPFKFAIPQKFEIDLWVGMIDVINNIILFLPIGFLFQLSRSAKNTSRKIFDLIFVGLIFSLFIEIIQLFLAGRYSSPVDLINNTLGCLLGGAVVIMFERKFKSASSRLFSFRLPLMNVVLLILPLCWINTFFSYSLAGQFVRLLLLSCIGSFTLAKIYRHHLKEQINGSRKLGALMVFSWNLVAFMPLLYDNYKLLLGLLAANIVVTILLFASSDIINPLSSRFEIPTLKRILPLLTLYLFLTNFWPFKIPSLDIQIITGFINLAAEPETFSLLKILEFISSFALIGYLIAELSSRWQETKGFDNYWLFAVLASLAAEIELLRGIHPDFSLNVLRLCFGIMGGFFGIYIFNMQLIDLKKYNRLRVRFSAE